MIVLYLGVQSHRAAGAGAAAGAHREADGEGGAMRWSRAERPRVSGLPPRAIPGGGPHTVQHATVLFALLCYL